MEGKDTKMGIPPSPPAAAGSFNGVHAKSAEMPLHSMAGPPTRVHIPTPVRPDAVRAAAAAVIGSDLSGRGTIAFAPPLELAAASPPPYMPDLTSTSAIVPHVIPGSHTTPSVFTGSAETMMKKKRGRPRKYGPDGTVAISIKPAIPSPLSSLQKRGRGRPPGSGKKQQLAALGEFLCGIGGAGFTPHAITVATGEDVAAKIMSFSQQGPRGICILSANGAISNVTLRQPSTLGGTVTYEGRFEILSLSGSFLVTESGGTRSRTGGLSVSLAGPDGRVMGGGVAGLLMAASPVQVVVGSFLCGSKKAQSKASKAEGASNVSALREVGTSGAPEVSMNNDFGDNKPSADDSPPLNQSSGNASSSNDESPPQAGQTIGVHVGWSGCQGHPLESMHHDDIDISSPTS